MVMAGIRGRMKNLFFGIWNNKTINKFMHTLFLVFHSHSTYEFYVLADLLLYFLAKDLRIFILFIFLGDEFPTYSYTIMVHIIMYHVNLTCDQALTLHVIYSQRKSSGIPVMGRTPRLRKLYPPNGTVSMRKLELGPLSTCTP